MKINTKSFAAARGKKLTLSKWPTAIKPLYKSKTDYQEQLSKNVKELARLQNLLYADNRYSVLLIFQAMDAAGKDSTIRRVLSGINPQGCQVYSFKQPSAEELEHDFLWRTNRCLPEKGNIGVFNRSYYEEVLIVRVHPEILLNQHLPLETTGDKKFWDRRFESIQDLEKHLHRNGTKIIKFFLHVSREEQESRFLSRTENPEKNWKFNSGDFSEGKRWKDYMKAYEICISASSTKDSPWYVVPADDKKNIHLIVSQIILESLKSLKMEYPTLTKKQALELEVAKNALQGSQKQKKRSTL